MIMELTSQTYGILEVKKASGVIWSDPFIWQAASCYRQGDGVKGSDLSAGLIKSLLNGQYRPRTLTTIFLNVNSPYLNFLTLKFYPAKPA